MQTKQSFKVGQIFFATVPPFNEISKYRNTMLKQKVISTAGESTDYLFDIFDNARNDCKTQVMFKSDTKQNNPVRILLLDFINSSTLPEKKRHFGALAKRMYDITDERNGLGLFVMIEGL